MRPERVYTLSNSAQENAVVAFERAADGTLVPLGRLEPLSGLPENFGPAFGYRPAAGFPTGGRGTGGVVVSQGGLALDAAGRHLFVVNPGSDDISTFVVTATGLRLVGRTPSHGAEPRSLAVHDDLLYVVNGLGTGSVCGFRIGANGALTHLAGSTRHLDPDSGPVQISFDPAGRHLVVAELFADRISVFPVAADGRPGQVVANPSAGESPFGFAFTAAGHLVVSESFGFRADESAVSSYRLDAGGKLHAVSSSVATGQTAACWIANTPDGRFSYTSNTGSGSISGYRVTATGKLIPLSGDGRTGVTGSLSFPVDMVTSGDGQLLYALNQGRQELGSFRIGVDGRLRPAPGTGGLPPFAFGLAVG